MNLVKMPTRLMLSAALVLALSCNSGTDKKDNTPAADTTVHPVAAAPVSTDFMTIKHKVANYTKWLPGYEGNDSMRMANGLHSYMVARGVEDSNMVLVAVRMDNIDKAKAFTANPGLKDAMQKAGVTGPPEIDYLHSVMNDTATVPQTIRELVKFKVKDWDAWRKVFDTDKQDRINAGITDRVIAYTVGDTHMVTLVFAIADMAKAKAFMMSKALGEKMKSSGVEGQPSSFFYRVAHKY